MFNSNDPYSQQPLPQQDMNRLHRPHTSTVPEQKLYRPLYSKVVTGAAPLQIRPCHSTKHLGAFNKTTARVPTTTQATSTTTTTAPNVLRQERQNHTNHLHPLSHSSSCVTNVTRTLNTANPCSFRVYDG